MGEKARAGAAELGRGALNTARGAGLAGRLWARHAGKRDGEAGLVETTGPGGAAASGWLAARAAEGVADAGRALEARLPAIEAAELQLDQLRGVYADVLRALPDDDARAAAEQTRCEALAALKALREALDAVWAQADAAARRFEVLGHTYLRAAKLPASRLPPCKLPDRLNDFETRYGGYGKLVTSGYFDRHH